MCIIAVIPNGHELPSKDTLKTCFTNNPNGAGFMFNRNGYVYVRKGFDSFEKLYKELASFKRDNPKSTFIVHFRIATQGFTLKCTQPFIVSDNMLKLKSAQQRGLLGIAHNGVIDIACDDSREWDSKAHKWIDKEVPYSDTMTFITRYLAWIDDPLSKRGLTLISNLVDTHNRLALLTPNGKFKLVGDGWIEDGGVWYSNTTYKSVPKVSYSLSKLNYPIACDTCRTWDCLHCKAYEEEINEGVHSWRV